MPHDKGRYGLSASDVRNLNHRWNREHMRFNDWESFDSFLYWCSFTGYTKGLEICRHDESKPHGPGNSFWADRSQVAEERKKARQKAREKEKEARQKERIAKALERREAKKIARLEAREKAKQEAAEKAKRDEYRSGPCIGCEKTCLEGCARWNEWFVKNWDENIRKAAPKQDNRDCFRYEHPDLIREGIV